MEAENKLTCREWILYEKRETGPRRSGEWQSVGMFDYVFIISLDFSRKT